MYREITNSDTAARRQGLVYPEPQLPLVSTRRFVLLNSSKKQTQACVSGPIKLGGCVCCVSSSFARLS
jgi:hypothetical protein